jgi:thiamine-phosphate pyrophosphorylase
MEHPSKANHPIVAGPASTLVAGTSRWTRGVYLVTREEPDTARLAAVVGAAIDGGVVLVQYRDKSTDAERRRRQAELLRAITSAAGVPLLINDDVDLARAIGADGVHLGRDDAGIEIARAALGPAAIIGVSCYSDVDRARRLAAAGADYVAFGSMFPSTTKPAATRAPLSVLKEAAGLGVPRAAIGGIDATNAGMLVAAGADLLAVIGAICDAADPRSATRAIAAAFGRISAR